MKDPPPGREVGSRELAGSFPGAANHKARPRGFRDPGADLALPGLGTNRRADHLTMPTGCPFEPVIKLPGMSEPEFNVENPRFWLKDDTALLNPVPKVVLNVVGAMPKPMNPGVVPVANPLLKPLKNVLPVNAVPKGLVKPLVGTVRLGWPVIRKNWLSGVTRFRKAEPKAPLTAVSNPVLPNWRFCRAAARLLATYLDKMGEGGQAKVLHPSFDVLKATGRTSSFGEINAQNLPRKDPRVRRCFVPRPGHVFLDFDYRAIERATLAQAVTAQFGWPSRMADAINAEEDLHRRLAARIFQVAEGEVTDD